MQQLIAEMLQLFAELDAAVGSRMQQLFAEFDAAVTVLAELDATVSSRNGFSS